MMLPTPFTRRRFIETTVAAMLPIGSALVEPKTKYTRYNVTSAGGKKALASYAKGVEAMLKLPADHAQNWFRNAFIHILDCPHGNWWFYVWHRGYLGYFEQTIRNLSGDPEFALPYWDWTVLPQIPDALFDGVLTPRDAAYEPYTSDLARFTAFLQPALKGYWGSLNPAQRAQLKLRGYTEFDLLWNDVTGYSPKNDFGISGNLAYATTCGSRYLTRENPKLDKNTAYDVSPFVVDAGLSCTEFYRSEGNLSFTSSKTSSHSAQPDGTTVFSVLEGLPHNKVHNYIGGVGPLDPGPYGSMTNFLSSVDPIFFLHHANMDRLWDVWTRKQQRLNLPTLPTGHDLEAFSADPFLFFVDSKGQYVSQSHAGDFVSMDRFEYSYEPGFGEDVTRPAIHGLLGDQTATATLLTGSVKNNTGLVEMSKLSIKQHLAAPGATLLAEVTFPRPDATRSTAREFDVLVGAPRDVDEVNADSPYYAGTLAFFGNMSAMEGMPMDTTFVVPLPKAQQAFSAALAALPNGSASADLSIRVVPSNGRSETAPVLKSVAIRAL
jgi:tyrosinase